MSSGVRFLTAVALSATTLVVLAVNARSARATEVDLLLALATDVSSSVDGTNFRLQREGYSAAITSPRVIEAIRSGRLGRIAICYIEWSGVGEQKVLIDWTVIQDAASASRFVRELAKKPRTYNGSTSVSGAIDFATNQIERAPFKAMRSVIDVAGDGDSSNSGREVTLARDEAIMKGITINALLILTQNQLFSRDPSPFGPNRSAYHTGHLEHYYRYNVIGGPSAFVMVAIDSVSFDEVIIRKFVSEITAYPATRSVAGATKGTGQAAR